MPQLHWSHFKAEFAGKPDEDMEVHLLGMNDWMDTCTFQEDVKVQHFCLTLVGETNLWYESVRPINVDCIRLQNQFRQQYSKIGNMREQVFHTWRSFHFETLDSYGHMHNTGSHIIRLLQTTSVRSFQKYTSYKNLLGTISYRRLKTSSRKS